MFKEDICPVAVTSCSLSGSYHPTPESLQGSPHNEAIPRAWKIAENTKKPSEKEFHVLIFSQTNLIIRNC
jgi:hypothetical protein